MKVRIRCQSLVIVVKPHLVVLEPIDARRGERHFTAFFAPAPKQRPRVWTPHLTDGNHRRFFRVTEDSLQAWAHRLQEDLVQTYQASHMRVELGELEADGWVVWCPREPLLDKLASALRTSPGNFRLDDAAAASLHEVLAAEFEQEHLAPTTVDPSMCQRPLGLFGLNGEVAWLVHYPPGCPSMKAGWYRVPSDWGAQRIVQRHAPTALRIALMKVKVFLGLAERRSVLRRTPRRAQSKPSVRFRRPGMRST
ncbi:MAG: hypothetical protein JWN04_6535 [Myxococcaceae bacterium]|nr:hypothetical protein [Myxococcaceae bacterium]